jgi:transposase-like protein
MNCPCCNHAFTGKLRDAEAWREGRLKIVRQMRSDRATVREIAAALNLSVAQAHYWVRQGRMQAEREDGAIMEKQET